MKKSSPQFGESLYGICSNTDAARKQKQMSLALTVMVLRAIIAPAEVLIRKRFGERYFGGPILMFNVVILTLMMFLVPRGMQPYVWLIFVILLLGMAYHQSVCFRRDRRGEYWHSYSDGIPFFRIAALERFMARKRYFGDSSRLFVEPVALFFIGWLISLPVSSGPMQQGNFGAYSPLSKILIVLSMYLTVASFAMFIYQQIDRAFRKEALLDAKDAQVSAQAAMQESNSSRGVRVSDYGGIIVKPSHDMDEANWSN